MKSTFQLLLTSDPIEDHNNLETKQGCKYDNVF